MWIKQAMAEESKRFYKQFSHEVIVLHGISALFLWIFFWQSKLSKSLFDCLKLNKESFSILFFLLPAFTTKKNLIRNLTVIFLQKKIFGVPYLWRFHSSKLMIYNFHKSFSILITVLVLVIDLILKHKSTAWI